MPRTHFAFPHKGYKITSFPITSPIQNIAIKKDVKVCLRALHDKNPFWANAGLFFSNTLWPIIKRIQPTTKKKTRIFQLVIIASPVNTKIPKYRAAIKPRHSPIISHELTNIPRYGIESWENISVSANLENNIREIPKKWQISFPRVWCSFL